MEINEKALRKVRENVPKSYSIPLNLTYRTDQDNNINNYCHFGNRTTRQELCLENSYLSNAMANPAVMVLNSSCGGNVTPHAQSQVTFARHPTGGQGGKDSVGSTPFTSPTFPVRPFFGQENPYQLLPLHHPALIASHALGRSYLSAGAFRPLGALTDDRGGPFHGSAFMPAKCMKLDGHSPDSGAVTQLLGSCFQGSESSFHQSPANSTGSLGQTVGSFLDGKDDRGDSDSMADGADRMSETPNLSEESRSIERSTPEERGTPKRHKKFYFEGGQTPFCPICGQSLQLSDLATHFEMEVERLPEIRKCISQQLEVASPFSSPMCMVRKDDKGKPESRWETYQRVKSNRTTRLTSARCMIKRKKWDDSERSPEDNLHLLPLRKREGSQELSPEQSIDSRTAAEINWAMSARMHAIAAAALQRNLTDFSARKFETPEDENQELNVDEDDSALYGQPHYTEADVITCSSEDNVDSKEQIRRIQSNDSTYQRHSESNQWTINGGNNNGEGQEVTSTCVTNNDAGECVSPSEKASKQNKDPNSDNPKDQMEEGIKCLICTETFIKPVVSICCWHVHCEECWLKTLGTKKLCPQCNMITAAKDLRRIYL